MESGGYPVNLTVPDKLLPLNVQSKCRKVPHVVARAECEEEL